ncbi:hypothetical protein [Bacteroides fragilis]
MADKKESELLKVIPSLVRVLDLQGNSGNIDLGSLLSLMLNHGIYEDDIDLIRTNGLFYTNGHTVGFNKTGILICFHINVASVQLFFGISGEENIYRVWLYSQNKYGAWRTL